MRHGRFIDDAVVRFDPATKQFKRYLIKSRPASMRRLGVDAKGFIWYGVYGTVGKAGKIGRLDPAKGLRELLAAHASLDDDVVLVVVGEGPMRAEIEAARSASHHILSWLFPGNVTPAGMIQVMEGLMGSVVPWVPQKMASEDSM